MPPETPEREPSKWRTGDRFLLKLWIIVATIWAIATLLRVDRVWRLTEEWAAIVRGPWLWLELVLPPLMFGCIIFAIRYIARSQTPHRSPPRR
jgi:hypothetical protein